LPSVIGITTSYAKAQQRLDYNYVRAVVDAGGLPVIVPFLQTFEDAEAVAAHLDGLIIPGGPGITEGLIGALPPELPPTDPLRLQADHAMLDACERRNLPMLGICYGMQLLNARAGGAIYGDVEQQVPSAATHSDHRGATDHPLKIAPGSCLSKILGTEELRVNTYHLQAVATLGTGLRVSAWADDGVIEAIEDANGLHVGVQFHPERMGSVMQPLFRCLVERAGT